MKTVGDRIRSVREDLGLTGEEFGNKLNVTKVAVSNWENGNRKPDGEMLVKIADLSGVSTDYLLCRTDEKKGIIVEYNINGDDIIFEVSKDVYPEGLTKEEILEKLKILKKLEEMGIQFPEDKE
ncbi:MAG: helix-turn-helix domain-containing protein [Clostridium sp.]|uniref:helix-turn-helix domain-containing protein n=1 Tax=Clostridium sp. TaxID=1506 RepID=UPI003F2C4DAF